MRVLGWIVAAVVVGASAPARGDDGSGSAGSGSSGDAVDAKLAAMQAQIDELRAGVDVATASAVDGAGKEPTFRIYGYIDAGFQKVWTTDPASVATTADTFVLGNVDLYFDFHPVTDWSSLVEVRFTNYPGGEDTYVQDPGNSVGDDTVQWSGIVLERAYIQWQHREELGVRVGEFLTPYGIWNVDHGTPTLISLYRPEFVSLQLWPEHQVGVEVFGRRRGLLPGKWVAEYHAYVSNGRTIGAVDLSDGKMVGGRVVARRDKLALGMSAMIDVDGDAMPTTTSLAATTTITPPGATESGIGVDASIDLGAWRLRGEAIVRHVTATVTTPTILQSDAYALAGYRIPGTRFEPVAFAEVLHMPTAEGDAQIDGSLGLNVYFAPSIQLKMQASRAWVWDDAALWRGATKQETFLAAKLVMGL